MTQNSNIRRIDDLGRIVIPKDIRKKLHIRESEPLEIYIDDGEIRIKKYSSLPDVKEYISSLLDIGSRVTTSKFIVTDREKFIASTDYRLESLPLDERLEQLVLSCTEKKNERDTLYLNGRPTPVRLNAAPLIVDNDRAGLIIEYSEEKELQSNDTLRVLKNLIENQLNNY